MTAHFVLGIGGTGAKTVEAFVRLATCGLGPDAAWVGLLDQDRSNGNSARAMRVLSDYAQLRAALRSPGEADLGGSPLLGMRLQQPEAGWAWAPEERSAASLGSAIGYPALPPSDQALVQALFTDEERRLELDEGFRQRPALGAALTLQGVTPESPVWRDLLAALQSAGHGGEVRVFLVASIFGGTGAAGLPTVARLLRTEIRRRNLEGQVKLGGALLLPYFAFPPPPPGAGPAIRPDSSAFMLQARGALEYYAQLFRAERVFDRLYLVGNDPLIPLRTYADGGAGQANPPLLPELIAGLACVDFLCRDADLPGFDTPQTLAAGTGAATPGWDDLPYDGPGGPAFLRAELAATVRTALAWRQAYAPALAGEAWRACRREAWFRRLLMSEGSAPVGSELSQRAITLATRLFDDLLRWFVALNRGGNGRGSLALLQDGLLARDWTSPSMDELALTPALSNAGFASAVLPRGGPSLREVFARLTYGAVPVDGAGVGMLVGALRAACHDGTAGE